MRTKILLSKPKWEITKITNIQITKSMNGLPSRHVSSFPKGGHSISAHIKGEENTKTFNSCIKFLWDLIV